MPKNDLNSSKPMVKLSNREKVPGQLGTEEVFAEIVALISASRGISKRGNQYLRKILIHGARSVVLNSKRDRVQMGQWMSALEARAPKNVLVVAVANKLARIAWAVLSSGNDYRAFPVPMAT